MSATKGRGVGWGWLERIWLRIGRPNARVLPEPWRRGRISEPPRTGGHITHSLCHPDDVPASKYARESLLLDLRGSLETQLVYCPVQAAF